jgi:hypothetical protein
MKNFITSRNDFRQGIVSMGIGKLKKFAQGYRNPAAPILLTLRLLFTGTVTVCGSRGYQS